MNNGRDTWIGRFADRRDAGRRLAVRLNHLRGEDVVVLGLPRGGVPVAFEVARSLGVPLDTVAVRSLTMPGHRQLSMGAIGEGGFEVIDDEMIVRARISPEDVEQTGAAQRLELDQMVARLRHGRERVTLAGRTALIVDDGIATGSTARVACAIARHLGAARVVLAIPVGPAELVHELRCADEVVCLSTPFPFLAVGYSYENFAPTSDDEVAGLLDAAAARVAGLEPEPAGT